MQKIKPQKSQKETHGTHQAIQKAKLRTYIVCLSANCILLQFLKTHRITCK